MRRLAALALALSLSAPASAQTDPMELARIAADRLEAAQAALVAADGARDRVNALTRTIGAYEDGLNALREGVRQATLRESAILAEFDAASADVSQLLGVLMSIRSTQGPLALIHPAGPLDGARAGMILGDVTPALQARAAELDGQLQQLAAAKALQSAAVDLLETGLGGAQKARTELSKAISDRRDLPPPLTDNTTALANLRDSAETMQDFASGLAQLAVSAGQTAEFQPFDSAMGLLPLPVRGQLLRSFNEPDAAGIRRPGLILATRPLSLVTAPWPATLRYAGPLLDYGQVAILEPQAGTLLILAGMGTIYGPEGRVVAAGEPIGLMGGQAPDSNTFLLDLKNGTGSAQTETLYIELRQETDPVDPAGWFTETKDAMQ